MAIAQMEEVYGKAESRQILGAATQAFNDSMMSEFQAQRAYGPDAVKQVYDAMVAGDTDAKITYVCRYTVYLERYRYLHFALETNSE